MNITARKYNPGFLSDDEMVASFCVRTSEFESIVEMLRDCLGSSNPHQLVIGPRGFGKTSLLLRIAAEIRRDAALSSHFFPIVFAEESYEVSTAGEFWLECLSCLAVQAPRRKNDPDLSHTYDELRGISDDRTLGERCLGALLDFSDREGKRLVLFVENLNTMFREMTDPETGWRLRKILQTEPRIILLASATSRFDQIDNPDQALYDLFRIILLRPLEMQECVDLWETVAGRESRQGTIQSLRILTGGNPRLFVIVARFGASLSFRELMTDLLDLVDDHTEYFRSHLEVLPAQERRVYLALADLWKPATTKEIADRARLETSKCSAQLTRLVERGIVEVAGGTARRKQYYLIERMYNIYYLLRRSRGPHRLVESLIRFMESFYSPLVLRDIGHGIARDALNVHGDLRALHEIALEKLLLLPALAQHRGELLATFESNSGSIATKPSDIQADHAPVGSDASAEAAGRELIERGSALRGKKRLDEALSIFDEVISRYGKSTMPNLSDLAAKALVRKGEIFWALNQAEEALATCEEVVRRYGEDETPVLRETVAAALLNKAVALHGLSRLEEALAASDEVVRRFGASENSNILVTVAKALCDKGITLGKMSRLQDALDVSDELIRRFGGNEEKDAVVAVAKTLCNKGAMLDRINRSEEALAIYDEVVRRYGASNEPALQEMVATALLNKGATLGDKNRPNDALLAFDEVVRRFGTSEESALLGTVALAMSNKGYSLAALNRPHEALTIYDDVVGRFGTSESPSVLEAVGKALFNKANALNTLNRLEDVLSVYEETVRRFDANETPIFQEIIATALCNKGITLNKLSKHEEAVTTYDDVVSRFGTSDAPGVIEMVTKSFLNKGYALSALSRPEEALAAYDEAVRYPGEIRNPSILALVAHALVKKGLTLVALKRSEEAVAIYNEAIRRYGTSVEPSVRGLVAQSFLNKGVALSTLNRFVEALEACDEVTRRYGGSEELDLLQSVAKALVNKAGILLTMTRQKEALYICDEVVQRFGESEEPVLVHMTADALYVKGAGLLELNRPVEAHAAFDEVLRRSPAAEKIAIPELVAKALLGKGLAFDKLNRPDEALEAYDEVVRRFDESKNLFVGGPVASALARKIPILDNVNRQAEALAIHGELVRRLGEDVPEYHELIEQALLDKANLHLVCGRHASAIETADRALEQSQSKSVENRLRAHFIRARATLAAGDTHGCESDIEAILSDLPELGNLPNENLQALMELGIQLGPRRMQELVEVSPSAVLLLPLTTALAYEQGLIPRVAREVEEVARDIQKKLESLRDEASRESSQTDNDKQVRNQPRISGIIIRDKWNRTLPIRHGPVRLAVVGEGGEKSNSWKIWMEKDGEIYCSIREKNPGFKVSLHKSGKQHIKMGNEYWGQWHEPDIYAGPMGATSAKLVFPAWGMREYDKMSEGEKETWRGNEIEINAPKEGKLIVVSVFIRTEGQDLRQEDGRSETLAVWRREDGKEVHLIVSEETERNFRDIVMKALKNKTVLQNLKDTIRDASWDNDRVVTATLAGPANEGGNYVLSVATTIQARDGKHGKEFIPIVRGIDLLA